MLMLAVFLIPLAAAGQQVTTKYGDVEGFVYETKSQTSADVFLNIPFAQPPVGNLRFERPVPPLPWQGVRNASAFGPACYPTTPFMEEPNTSEDCLQLNIIRPSNVTTASKLPVLIWIYGGGYEIGSANQYGYAGFADIYTPHDIIVVSIQYRLGILGFFSTGDSEMPGNLGMWDQVEALRWLYENIEHFGGDKHRLIVWGHSAGAGAVSGLTLSPHSRDLVYASVEQSGSAWAGFFVGTYVAEYSAEFAKTIGCVGGVKNCLKNKTIQEIYDSYANTAAVTQLVGSTKCGPRIDGDFMPAMPDELLNGVPPKPTLITQGRKEANFFTTFGLVPPIMNPYYVDMNNTAVFNRQHLIDAIQTFLINSEYYTCKTDKALAKVVKRYVDQAYKPGFGNDYFIDQFTEFVSDTFFNVAGLAGANAKRNAGWPVYLYRLNHANEVIYPTNINGGFPDRCKGSPHSNDHSYTLGQFLFGNFDTQSPTELPVTRAQQDNIIAFAKTGKPLFPDVGKKKNSLSYFEITETPKFSKSGLYPGLLDFWHDMRKFGFDVIGLVPTQCKA